VDSGFGGSAQEHLGSQIASSDKVLGSFKLGGNCLLVSQRSYSPETDKQPKNIIPLAQSKERVET